MTARFPYMGTQPDELLISEVGGTTWAFRLASRPDVVCVMTACKMEDGTSSATSVIGWTAIDDEHGMEEFPGTVTAAANDAVEGIRGGCREDGTLDVPATLCHATGHLGMSLLDASISRDSLVGEERGERHSMYAAMSALMNAMSAYLRDMAEGEMEGAR